MSAKRIDRKRNGRQIFAPAGSHGLMTRSKLIVVFSMLLFAFLLAGANPAFAHGTHEQGVVPASGWQADPAERSDALAVAVIAASGAMPGLALAPGNVWLASDDGARAAGVLCHGSVTCCANHCCVGGALPANEPELPALFDAGASVLIASSQPDDAPSQASLRPPCR